MMLDMSFLREPAEALSPAWFAERRAKRERAVSKALSFERYRFEPARYIRDVFGWTPWAGDDEHPGQAEIVEAYRRVLHQMHEREVFNRGLATQRDLRWWKPGERIRNRLRIEAGVSTGKTKCASALISHFFDCWSSSDPREGCIVQTYAPTFPQINTLLWKEIRADRGAAGMAFQPLQEPRMQGHHGKHLAMGRAFSKSGGKAGENIQGQHGGRMLFVVDEAEGVPAEVFDAIDRMATGGIAIVILLANPRTQTSRFYKMRTRKDVQNFRISCLQHPNVLTGREVVPGGAVDRDWVDTMIETHCERVDVSDLEANTFGVAWHPGDIFKPDVEFLYAVMGIPPALGSVEALVSLASYEQALKRMAARAGDWATLGLDCARRGHDAGSLWARHGDVMWRAAQLHHREQGELPTQDYVAAVKSAALDLKRAGGRRLYVRVDAGYGGGIIDNLRADLELRSWFDVLMIAEVHFGSSPTDPVYADRITELYALGARCLKALRLDTPPEELQQDLCERMITWRIGAGGRQVRKLEDKELFRKRLHRSPDDGDAWALAVVPPETFGDAGERWFAPPVRTFKR